MKKFLLLGFLFALLAFSVSPVQSAPLLEDEARLEQTDVVIDIVDATQMITIDVESCQVATPLKYPTTIEISSNLISVEAHWMLQSNSNNINSRIESNTMNRQETNVKGQSWNMGLFMPNLGKSLNAHLI